VGFCRRVERPRFIFNAEKLQGIVSQASWAWRPLAEAETAKMSSKTPDSYRNVSDRILKTCDARFR
jgi:hypothetical protein